MNIQPPEPHIKEEALNLLDVHSFFFTIQGEGPFAGQRAIFLRLAGCNLQCPGCDTEYTQGRRKMDLRTICTALDHICLQNSIHSKTNLLVVITGGEPLRQPIGTLVRNLVYDGYRVQIESNGMFAPDATCERFLKSYPDRCILVVSPKTPKVNPRSAELADCFKYVLSSESVDPDDGLPIYALEHDLGKRVARPPHVSTPVYVNPYDAKDPQLNLRNLKAAAESAMRYGYILGVQIHKLVGLE